MAWHIRNEKEDHKKAENNFKKVFGSFSFCKKDRRVRK